MPSARSYRSAIVKAAREGRLSYIRSRGGVLFAVARGGQPLRIMFAAPVMAGATLALSPEHALLLDEPETAAQAADWLNEAAS